MRVAAISLAVGAAICAVSVFVLLLAFDLARSQNYLGALMFVFAAVMLVRAGADVVKLAIVSRSGK